MLFRLLSVTREIARGVPDEPWNSRDLLNFRLACADDRILEINDDCVVCSDGLHSIYYKANTPTARASLNPYLTVRPDAAREGAFSKVELADPAMASVIGKMIFFQPKSANDEYEAEGPALYFEAYIDQATFDGILTQLNHGICPAEIWIGMVSPVGFPAEGGRKFEFGWEPDGRRRVWTTRKEHTSDYLPLKDIGFSTSYLGEPETAGENSDESSAGAVSQPQMLNALLVAIRENQVATAALGKTLKFIASMAALFFLVVLLRIAN